MARIANGLGCRFRFLFSFSCNKNRARCAADHSFGRAPEQKMLQSAMSARRKDDQIGINLAGQTDNLLVWSPATYEAILRTKCRHMFAMNTGQFLVKAFDRFG